MQLQVVLADIVVVDDIDAITIGGSVNVSNAESNEPISPTAARCLSNAWSLRFEEECSAVVAVDSEVVDMYDDIVNKEMAAAVAQV